MKFESRDAFLDAVKGLAGSGLRAVTVYDRAGYDTVYLREDIDTLYAHEMYEDAHEGMILEGLGGDYLESLFSGGCSGVPFTDSRRRSSSTSSGTSTTDWS